jgi:hypothetical protein
MIDIEIFYMVLFVSVIIISGLTYVVMYNGHLMRKLKISHEVLKDNHRMLHSKYSELYNGSDTAQINNRSAGKL